MLDILILIKKSTKDINRWTEILIHTKEKETHFLVMFSALFSYTHSQLCKVRNSYPTLVNLIDEKTLIHIIKNDLKNILLPIIIKTCVYEMSIASKNQQLKGKTPESRFDYFINELKNPKLVFTLLKKYPLLEKISTISLQQYILTQSELFERLNQDYQKISRVILKNQTPLKITNVQSSGDKHQGGRSTCILSFKNEKTSLKLVYKPRPLDIDVSWMRLINWAVKKLNHKDIFEYKIINKKNMAGVNLLNIFHVRAQMKLNYFIIAWVLFYVLVIY